MQLDMLLSPLPLVCLHPLKLRASISLLSVWIPFAFFLSFFFTAFVFV